MKDFMEFISKNKYIIICVAVVVILYATGIINFIWNFLILVALVILAVYVGRRLQENNKYFSELFKFKFMRKDEEDNVYYYQEKKEKDNNKK